MKKKLGRPRKKEGAISFAAFLRAGIVMTLYDEARKNGQKHSGAVAQTVELIKQRDPTIPISETEVKRTLAGWRPQGSHMILHLECSMLNEEDLAKLEPQMAAMSQKQGSKLPAHLACQKSLSKTLPQVTESVYPRIVFHGF